MGEDDVRVFKEYYFGSLSNRCIYLTRNVAMKFLFIVEKHSINCLKSVLCKRIKIVEQILHIKLGKTKISAENALHFPANAELVTLFVSATGTTQSTFIYGVFVNIFWFCFSAINSSSFVLLFFSKY